MRKWYSFETLFRTLKDELRKYLKESHIKYELSGCFDGWHFEIYASEEEVNAINEWLDNNTIVEE